MWLKKAQKASKRKLERGRSERYRLLRQHVLVLPRMVLPISLHMWARIFLGSPLLRYSMMPRASQMCSLPMLQYCFLLGCIEDTVYCFQLEMGHPATWEFSCYLSFLSDELSSKISMFKLFVYIQMCIGVIVACDSVKMPLLKKFE